MSETELQTACMKILALHPKIYCWRNNTGCLKTKRGHFVRYGKVGSPDIIGVIGPNGRMFGIECKDAKGKSSEGQVTFRAEFEKRGGSYLLIRGLDELEPFLDGQI